MLVYYYMITILLLLLLFIFLLLKNNKSVESHVDQKNVNNFRNLDYKIHFYDFDRTITVRSIIKDATLDDMGGQQRLNQLHKYFAYLQDRKVKLYIVSYNLVKTIRRTLDKFDLLKYFDGIYGRDNTKFNKLGTIRQIVKYNNLSMMDGIFIDDKQKNVVLVSPYMRSYRVSDVVHGMNTFDMYKMLNSI